MVMKRKAEPKRRDNSRHEHMGETLNRDMYLGRVNR